MKELYISLFGMFVSGLAFISYKYPRLSKSIISMSLAAFTVAYGIKYMRNEGRIDNYESVDAILNHSPGLPLMKVDTMNYPKFDPSDTTWEQGLKAMKNKYPSMERELWHYGVEMAVREKIAKEINEHSNDARQQFEIIRWAYIISILVLLGLYYFADMFDKFRNPQKKYNQNKPPKASF